MYFSGKQYHSDINIKMIEIIEKTTQQNMFFILHFISLSTIIYSGILFILLTKQFCFYWLVRVEFIASPPPQNGLLFVLLSLVILCIY